MSAALDLEIAQLLASRICHDLISPVSAVNNGLELLAEDGDADMHAHALSLVQKSAKTTSIKLQVMRAAFGSGQTLSDQNSPETLSALLSPLMLHHKMTLLWKNIKQDIFSRDESRLLLNIILLSIEILPRGGEVTLQSATPDKEGILFSLKGQKVIFSQEKQNYFQGTLEKPSEPRGIALYIIRLLAEKVGWSDMHFTLSEGEMSLSFLTK